MWCKPKHDVSWGRAKTKLGKSDAKGAEGVAGWVAEWLSDEVRGEW